MRPADDPRRHRHRAHRTERELETALLRGGRRSSARPAARQRAGPHRVEQLRRRHRGAGRALPRVRHGHARWGDSGPATVDRLDHVAAAIELLDAVGIARPAFVGNSMGGQASLRPATEHPGRISHLVTVGPRRSAGRRRSSAPATARRRA
ncbi:alpha/beta fold hydrolase [Spongiactinospora sp. 9N601]|uniref:alpha/beta fold hydrolase n=1 Tax=Spongiactinospora sp. 9N601 TaxID=3375149 RepID=UPI0037AB767D